MSLKNPPIPPRPRGRPRTFDDAAVLAALLEVFWDKGFAAASVDDLERAAGIGRPSLYAAFGDKRTMYLRALAAFEARMAGHLAPALDPSVPLRSGMRDFLMRALDIYAGSPRVQRGCLVFGTAAAEAPDDPGIRATLAAAVERLDSVLQARFAAAARQGELRTGASAGGLAAATAALLHSLALRARAGISRARLIEFIDAGVDALLGGAPVAPRKERRRAATLRARTAAAAVPIHGAPSPRRKPAR